MGSHTHRFEIPPHAHEIEPGIYFFGGASGFTIRANGVDLQTVNASDAEVELTDALVQDGVIPRGTWHEIDIVPNGLSYVSIDMFVQGFIQKQVVLEPPVPAVHTGVAIGDMAAGDLHPRLVVAAQHRAARHLRVYGCDGAQAIAEHRGPVLRRRRLLHHRRV